MNTKPILLFVLLALPAWGQQEWYKGGTLHGADIQTWLVSDYQNRLATAGDFFVSMSRKENPKLLDDVPKSNFTQVMKLYAIELDKCITKTGDGKGLEDFKAVELAAICYMMMYKNK